MFEKLKKVLLPNRYHPDTIIDVRGYAGFNNHLIRYEEYAKPFSEKPATLCGFTEWLTRDPEIFKSVIVESGKQLNPAHYCYSCYKIYQSGLPTGKNE